MDIVEHKRSENPTQSHQTKLSYGQHYERQAEEIKKQFGELDEIRTQLGLSARRICQILMVDPSAWTRWTKHGDPVPPHIWRSMQLLMILRERMPDLSVDQLSKIKTESHHQDVMHRVSDLKENIKNLEHAVKVNKISAILIGISFLILAFAFYRIMKA